MLGIQPIIDKLHSHENATLDRYELHLKVLMQSHHCHQSNCEVSQFRGPPFNGWIMVGSSAGAPEVQDFTCYLTDRR